MILVFGHYVREFVDDDVINDKHGGLDKAPVEIDAVHGELLLCKHFLSFPNLDAMGRAQTNLG